jgi:hypothetical protein
LTLGFVGWGLKSLLKNFDVPAVDDLFMGTPRMERAAKV